MSRNERLREDVSVVRRGEARVIPSRTAVFKPRMELYDDPDSPDIVATFELPGIKTSDLSITVRQGMLCIHGRRSHPRFQSRTHPSVRGQPQAETGAMDVDASQSAQTRKPEARHFPVHELRYGPFRRVVQLPTNADTSCINASLSDGMLSVSWPRFPHGPRLIESAVMQEHPAVERPTSSVRADPRGATNPHYRGSE